MKKYRMYTATVTRVSRHLSDEFDYECIIKSEDANADYEYESTFDTAEKAVEYAATLPSEKEVLIVKRPRAKDTFITRTNHFSSESSARSWAEDQREAMSASLRKGDSISVNIHEETFDEDDISEMEYAPIYTVTLEIKEVKHLEVEIDTSEHDEVEDEYDARARAEEMFNCGDLEHEMQYADCWDTEVEAYDCEES